MVRVMWLAGVAASVVWAGATHPASGQIVNPADKQREIQESSRESPSRQMTVVEPPPTTAPAPSNNSGVAAAPAREPRASFELPPVEVVGEPGPALREEQRIGPYAQPRWTARRTFPGTRIYVRPPGTAEFEYWLRPTITKDGDTEMRTLYELSVGFEPRLQLDLYLRTDQAGDDSETLVGQQVELRYALADWGKLWGNPTLYVEWVGLEQRPDAFEAKLLLGDELAPAWHWGVNLSGEFQLGGEREYEYQLTGGLSHTMVDSRFSLGGEAILELTDVKDDRGNFNTSLLIGPSLQFKPSDRLSFTFSPLVGLTDESPDFRAFLVVGYEF